MSAPLPDTFAARVLEWFARAGRKDLPWQRAPTPYRVWVSEIMLQQTRVSTVVPYYERFMGRFPDPVRLADAPLDEVLHHWSGLGYYARARNLHRAAHTVRDEHGGRVPAALDALQALPGVGRSTAGAILALAGGQRHPILDGNVKRVLARFHAVEGWPGQPRIARHLWALAERHTPHRQVASYTQAMMDLGATVCTRSRPACGDCPLVADCAAHRAGRQQFHPAPRPRKALPERCARMLMLYDGAGQVLLVRRPPSGIWGGLWGFPEVPAQVDIVPWARAALGLRVRALEPWQPVTHTFTHFRLHITPIPARLTGSASAVLEAGDSVWYNTGQSETRGLAAPVQRLLERLQREIAGGKDGAHGALREAG